MPVNAEAEEIARRATEMLERSSPQDAKTQRDIANLYLLAIKKAGGSYPTAESGLSWVSFLLRDHDTARSYARSSLKGDPDLWTSQYVLVGYAFAELPGFFASKKFREEFQKLVGIFLNLCATGIDDGYFAYYAEVMMNLADGATSKGAGSLKFVYQAIASASLEHVRGTTLQAKEAVAQVQLIAQARLLTV